MTYSLGFFFGPGLPRDLEPLSKALFAPALPPEAFFLGGSAAPGAGVALFSEASPLGEDAGALMVVGAAIGPETVDRVDFALELFRAVGFGRK